MGKKPIKILMSKKIIDIVEKNVKRNKENYYYFIYYLTFKSELEKGKKKKYRNKEGFVHVFSCSGKKITGKNSDFYIKFFKKENILEDDNISFHKTKKYHYRINPAMLDSDYDWITISTNSNVFKNIIQKNKNKKTNINQKHLKIMREKYMNIKFDLDGALKYVNQKIKTPSKKNIYMRKVSEIADKRLRYFSISESNGRLNTSITTFPKVMRKYIKGNHITLDLANSQPFFLFILIDKIIDNIINKNLEEEIKIAENNLSDVIDKNILKTILNSISRDILAKNDINKIKEELNIYKGITSKGILFPSPSTL